jgi:hypothetical protein
MIVVSITQNSLRGEAAWPFLQKRIFDFLRDVGSGVLLEFISNLIRLM